MKLSKALEEFLELQIIKGNSIETYNTYKKRIGYFISFCEDISLILIIKSSPNIIIKYS